MGLHRTWTLSWAANCLAPRLFDITTWFFATAQAKDPTETARFGIWCDIRGNYHYTTLPLHCLVPSEDGQTLVTKPIVKGQEQTTMIWELKANA